MPEFPFPRTPRTATSSRYPDKSGTYSKGLLQDGYGRVNLNAYQQHEDGIRHRRPRRL